jgi:hypothetical protein
MNGITKVPSRFTNVPPNSTHAAGGSDRRFWRRLGRAGSIALSVGMAGDVD